MSIIEPSHTWYVKLHVGDHGDQEVFRVLTWQLSPNGDFGANVVDRAGRVRSIILRDVDDNVGNRLIAPWDRRWAHANDEFTDTRR